MSKYFSATSTLRGRFVSCSQFLSMLFFVSFESSFVQSLWLSSLTFFSKFFLRSCWCQWLIWLLRYFVARSSFKCCSSFCEFSSFYCTVTSCDETVVYIRCYSRGFSKESQENIRKVSEYLRETHRFNSDFVLKR